MIDTKDALAALKNLESTWLSTIRQALGQSAALAGQLAKATTTFKDRTGKLRGSITREEKSTWRHVVTAGGKGVRYALFVEAGTKAHEIKARRADMLRFVQNGHLRFAKRVWHPGTKATNFMQTARDKAEIALVTFVQNGMSRAL